MIMRQMEVLPGPQKKLAYTPRISSTFDVVEVQIPEQIVQDGKYTFEAKVIEAIRRACSNRLCGAEVLIDTDISPAGDLTVTGADILCMTERCPLEGPGGSAGDLEPLQPLPFATGGLAEVELPGSTELN